MKKYVGYLILAFAVMFILPSCENGNELDFADNTLTLTLSCNDLGLTRATIDGEDEYNENTINAIDCYFYASGADFNTAALLVKNNISTLTQTATGTYTASIKFEEEELKTVFGTVNKGGSANCLIYVIANRPAGVALPMTDGVVKLATINELKALTITSDFKEPQAQAFFVMDSDGNPDSTNDTSVAGDANTDIDNDDIVTYTIDNNGTKSLTGIVPLYRTAAKITLSVNRFGKEGSNNTVVANGTTYTPNYGGVYAVLHNGVSNSVIAPDVVNQVSPNYFETADFSMAAQAAPCQLGVPFYSYASDWSGENSGNGVYITLVVPWRAEGVNSYTPYYYKVPVNFDGDKLERNTHYKIDLSVSILGTLNPDSTVTIEPSYTILNWSEDEVETSMSDFRYLMVEKNKYEMNNINTIDIPYWTSHNCTIVNISVKKPDLYNGGDRTIDVTSGYDLDLTTKDGNAYITYSRVLDNDYESENFDFAPYTITFRIQHTTESATYYEDIEIIQYPAIYGNYEVNVDGTNDDHIGYVFVNGYTNSGQTSTNSGWDFFGSVTELVGSPNRYIFTVTSVEGTPYVIGDPRDMEITYDGDEADWCDEGRRITNGVINTTENNEIRYYYGTDVTSTRYDNATSTDAIYANDVAAEAAERTINMVAPKFMLASGYAVLYTSATEVRTLENLKKRCASYQEDGYPAGRWRLPTRAEFELILTQVNKRTLPEVYVFNTTYWCAHGLGTPRNTNGVVSVEMEYVGRDDSGHSTRCVYDLWYWGEHDKMNTLAEKNEFTWGDVPRSEKAYAPSVNY